MKGLSKFFRIIEVPIYLSTIAVYSLLLGNIITPIIVTILAISRLIVNNLELKNEK